MREGANEERRTPRYSVEMRVRMALGEPGNSESWFGQASDLSEFGMSLFVAKEIELGATLQVEFQLPYSSQKLLIRGTVRNRDSFRYGVEFAYPSAAERQLIVRTCKMLGPPQQ